jgi:hypothetical protein
MTSPAEELTEGVAAEIHQLRKGRGLQDGDLEARLGPLLGELAGPGDAAHRRQALEAELRRSTTQLIDDYRTAIETSLALSADTMQEPHFGKRVSWLAAKLMRDDRTVLRRIEKAEQRLAQVIATELRRRRGRTAAAPEGWYVEELRTVFRLGTETVEVREDRRIVSARDDLTEVMAWRDVPGSAGQGGASQPETELQAEIEYGGHLLRQYQPSHHRFNHVVQLPKPLARGDKHEYRLVLRMPRGMLRHPHYLVTPECRFEKLDLRVRFDLQRPPAWVRRVDGETVRMFENEESTGEDLLIPDAAGEVQQEFRNLARYLGYGIQWRPAD